MTFSRVKILVPRGRVMRWHQSLQERLTKLYPDSEIFIHGKDGENEWPSGVAPLLALERLLLRRSMPTLADVIDLRPAQAATHCDVTIDLTGGAAAATGARVLRPLYDSEPSDSNAVCSLLAGRAPRLAVQDATTGAVFAQGLPSLEAADGLTGGLEAVYSRVIALIERGLAAPTPVPESLPASPKAAPRRPDAYALRNAAFQCARAIYHLCCHAPHWRVGWRFVNGPGLVETGALGDKRWRPMEDRELSFAADPFPIEWRGRMGIFYERLDYRTNKGLIYFQEFGPEGPKGEPLCAVEEPWHLSYPFLIQQDGELYMLPEASASGALMLYRCVDFPRRWERVATLLDKIEAADATIFVHNGRYYMTSVVRDGVGGYSDTLAIHHAPGLFGPWEEHALRPVLIDSRYARPAGALIRHGGALLRPVQDCSASYGGRLIVMRVDELAPETFRQTPLTTISPGGVWPGKRLHTVNRCGALECIDGAIFSPKSVTLRRMTNRLVDLRSASAQSTALAVS